MKPIVVAFDSFKGSLTSPQACSAFAFGIHDVLPDVEVRCVPISDGGEGFAELLGEALGGEVVECNASDPIGRRCVVHYAIVGGDMAIIALVEASGLTLLADDERNPLVASTYGTGEVILNAVERGCRHIVIGLGGSATTDAGTGMLRALGCRFYDAEGRELSLPIEILERTARVDDAAMRELLTGVTIDVAVDVDNPLYGERGAARVFAPQKGADEAMVERLDRALRDYAHFVDSRCGYDASMTEGTGAAGGVGYAFVALMGCALKRGIDLFLEMVKFRDVVADAGLVVTGEGCVDSQTLMGKAPSGVLHYAEAAGVPCVAVGGKVVMSETLEHSGFCAIYESKPASMSLCDAMHPIQAYQNLRDVGRKVAEAYKKGMTNK